jgi:hypothetical protein
MKRATKRKEDKKNENEMFEDNKSKMCSCSFVAINMKSLSAEFIFYIKKTLSHFMRSSANKIIIIAQKKKQRREYKCE